MSNKILVAGSTGDLGGKIIDALLEQNAQVRAIVRKESNLQKIDALRSKGVEVIEVDMDNIDELKSACMGVSCIVSALSGLRQTILVAQKNLFDAAIAAKVPRFIPSDYSIDFTNLNPGTNRNLDWRREFHQYMENKEIQVTSIFNGAFMELLTTDMPLILFKQYRILCWGSPDVKMDFTTTFNVASYTAQVALKSETPRYLRIAGDSLSANDFKMLLTNLTSTSYKLFRPGGIKLFSIFISIAKFFDRSQTELYPSWQGMQYMRNMMEGDAVIENHDNKDCNVNWTSVKSFLMEEVKVNRIELS